MEDDYITIPEAAVLLGHSTNTNLYAAAREWLAWKAQVDAGEDAGPERGLRVRQMGPKIRLTKPAWVDEYRSRQRAGGYKRGGSREGDGDA